MRGPPPRCCHFRHVRYERCSCRVSCRVSGEDHGRTRNAFHQTPLAFLGCKKLRFPAAVALRRGRGLALIVWVCELRVPASPPGRTTEPPVANPSFARVAELALAPELESQLLSSKLGSHRETYTRAWGLSRRKYYRLWFFFDPTPFLAQVVAGGRDGRRRGIMPRTSRRLRAARNVAAASRGFTQERSRHEYRGKAG